MYALIAFFVEEFMRWAENAVPDVLIGVVVNLVVSLPCGSLVLWVWFFIAQCTKRCHDRGISGWFQLIPFFVIVLLIAEGNQGVNKYGEAPKGVK